jgi:tetratricopeptide (TPR) repeat protein
MKFSGYRSLASSRAFRLLWLRFQGFGNLAQNSLSGFGRVRRLGDGPADHKIAGAGADGVGRGGDALLVADTGAGRPNAGNHQHAGGAGERAERAGFPRRADKSANAGGQSHTSQKLSFLGGRAVDCDRFELLGIHTGEDGDGKQFRRIGPVFERGAGCAEHSRTTERVKCDHARAVRRGRAYGSSDGVGDVVKLEIEKDGMSARNQRLQHGGAGGGKQFQSHLEPLALALKAIHQIESVGRTGCVQGYDEASARLFHSIWRLRRGCTRGGEAGLQTFWDGHTEIVKHGSTKNRRRWFLRRGDGTRKGDSRLNKASLGMRGMILGLGLLIAGAMAWGETIDTNPMNYDPQVQKAYAEFHELDFKDAVAGFERYHEEHPGDPQATAYLLNAEVFQELYRLDLLDTTFYANDGFLSGKHATVEDPKARARIMALANEVVSEANWRLSKNPNDVNALFARGWARSLECTYIAMVERGFSAGFRLASKAKNDETRVLQLDPDYADAKLIVGVYEYVVGALPWPFKFLIGFAGITGSKTKGMELLREAGEHGVITSAEARTVMALFLRREGKYRQAIKIIRGLEAEYPRDFLYRLEEANLRKDGGEGMAAVDAYREVIADAEKPGYFASAKLELADFGLGEALRGQRYYKQAAQAYEHAATTEDVGAELKIRSFLAGGQCRDLAEQRDQAVEDYRAAIEAGPNTSRADTARKYLHSPYRGS